MGIVHLRHTGQVDAASFDVELQTVIDAAQAALLVAAKEQRRGAMRAAFVQKTNASLRVAEQHQILAQEPDPHRRTIGVLRFDGKTPPESNSVASKRPCASRDRRESAVHFHLA